MVKQSNQTDGLTVELTELTLRDQVVVKTNDDTMVGTVLSLDATPTTHYVEIRKTGTTTRWTIEKVSGLTTRIYKSDDDTPQRHNVKDVKLRND